MSARGSSPLLTPVLMGLSLILVPPAFAQIVDTQGRPALRTDFVPGGDWGPYVAALASYRDRLQGHLDVSFRLGPDLFTDEEASNETRDSARTNLMRLLEEEDVHATWCSEPCGRSIVDPSIVSVRFGPVVVEDDSTIRLFLTASRWLDRSRGWYDRRNEELRLRKKGERWAVLDVRLESIN